MCPSHDRESAASGDTGDVPHPLADEHPAFRAAGCIPARSVAIPLVEELPAEEGRLDVEGAKKFLAV
jgi:hypothetical protein